MSEIEVYGWGVTHRICPINDELVTELTLGSIESSRFDEIYEELEYQETTEAGVGADYEIIIDGVALNKSLRENVKIRYVPDAVYSDGSTYLVRSEEASGCWFRLKIEDHFDPSKLEIVFSKIVFASNWSSIVGEVFYDGYAEFGETNPKGELVSVIHADGSVCEIVFQDDGEDDEDEDEVEDQEAADSELVPPGVQLKNEAIAVLNGGDPKGAIAMMREAQGIQLTEYDPIELQSIKITMSLASMLSDEGETDEAHEILINLLNKIEKIKGSYNSDYSRVCGWVARNLRNQKKWSEVLQYSERYLLYFHEPDRYYDLGLALEKLGRKREAEEVYQVALSYNDDEANPSMSMNLFWCSFRAVKGENFSQDRIESYLDSVIYYAEIIQDTKMLEQCRAEIESLKKG